MDRDWTASFSIRFRNGPCIIILDKKYNIANSSCHFGSYGSIWTGPSPKKYYMEENLLEIWQFKWIDNASAEMYMFNEVYCEINIKCETIL